MGEILTFPAPPEMRLRAALRSLEMALAEQHIALSDFRSDLAGLRDAVGGLGSSLGAYHQELCEVQRAAGDARDAARCLERTADAALKA